MKSIFSTWHKTLAKKIPYLLERVHVIAAFKIFRFNVDFKLLPLSAGTAYPGFFSIQESSNDDKSIYEFLILPTSNPCLLSHYLLREAPDCIRANRMPYSTRQHRTPRHYRGAEQSRARPSAVAAQFHSRSMLPWPNMTEQPACRPTAL